MFGSKTSKSLAAGLALAAAMAAGGAQAANHVLNLSGSAFDVVTNAFTFGGIDYETGYLELNGFTPFILADGDTVEVNVDIADGMFVVPSRDVMFFGLNFADISGGAQPTTSSANGFMSFDGGPTDAVGCSNCTSLINGQSGGTMQFTNLFATGSFTMDSPYEINSITVSYQVNNNAAVPEPASWALMIVGFGGAGLMIRRRRRHGQPLAA
jgi:hypothetical protein